MEIPFLVTKIQYIEMDDVIKNPYWEPYIYIRKRKAKKLVI